MVNPKILSYLIKLERWSCWLLFVLTVFFLITGYSMLGEYGLSRIISKREATDIHTVLGMPFLILFAFHMSLRIYFVLKRWFKK